MQVNTALSLTAKAAGSNKAMTSKHNTDAPRPIHRPKLFGNAYERHKAYVRDFVDVYEKGSSSAVAPQRKSDFDVLKETHK